MIMMSPHLTKRIKSISEHASEDESHELSSQFEDILKPVRVRLDVRKEEHKFQEFLDYNLEEVEISESEDSSSSYQKESTFKT